MNVQWLCQALELLDRMGERCFSVVPKGLEPHRVSSHMRHIIEFYECFLAGLPSKRIDYDSRRRDQTIESSPSVAAARIRAIIEELQKNPSLEQDDLLLIRVEDAESFCLEDPFLTSTVGRELMVLSSHTIHHFALIAMTLQAQGIAVDPAFGVAPSTLRFRKGPRTIQAA
jgi:hypothetical protein